VRLWAVALLVEEERGLYGVRLYGFASRAERQTFELLRSLPGIGARTALGILSAMSPGELRQLVLQRDVAALQRFPGIGRKTAERLVLELHERIAQLELDEHAPVAAGVRQEAIAALIALGYSRAQAERAVAAALQQSGETPAVEQLIKAALQQLR
jgi:Holliday junction DNA helicase RuvA